MQHAAPTLSARLGLILLRLFSAFPFRGIQAVGAAVGWLFWRIPNRERRVSAQNLARCYPERSRAWRDATLRRNLIEIGKTLTESLWLWGRGGRRGARYVRQVCGREVLEHALRSGRGVIFATPHFGNWEMVGGYIAQHTALATMFRPPRAEALATPLRAGRYQLGVTPVPAEASGVRTLHRTLLAGKAVGILPDQRPRQGEGIYAPFFGQSALTMTLLSRLARRSGALVVITAMERLPRGRGYRAHFWRAEAGVADGDAERAAAAINRECERCIALAPAQYNWNYKRFRKSRPARQTRTANEQPHD